MIPSAKYCAKVVVHGTLAFSRRAFRTPYARQPSLTIFTYHSFCATHPLDGLSSLPVVMFEKQIAWLRRTHLLVSLSDGLEFLKEASPETMPMAAITIDDGFENNYRIAWPVLVRQRVPATIFIATDFVDTGRPPWPTRLRDIIQALSRQRTFAAVAGGDTSVEAHYQRLQRELRCKDADARRDALDRMVTDYNLHDLPTRPALGWDQIREMAASGITFGSHTVSHGYLPSLRSTELSRELTESKRRIEQELQTRCRYFAYPNGDWSDAGARKVQEAGYCAAVTQDFGSNTRQRDPCSLLRVEVPSNDPLASFQYRAMRAVAKVPTIANRTNAGIP